MTVTDTNKIPYEYDKSVNFFHDFEYTGKIMEPQNIQVSGYIISSNDNENVEEIKAEELEEIKNKEEKETITKIVYTWGKGEEKFRKGTYDFSVNTTNLGKFSIGLAPPAEEIFLIYRFLSIPLISFLSNTFIIQLTNFHNCL